MTGLFDFAGKLEAIVGLYLNPPEHALVLSVDEKSQIQALDRTQPGLPLRKGRCQTMTLRVADYTSDKNKNVARVGHPAFCRIRIRSSAGVSWLCE